MNKKFFKVSLMICIPILVLLGVFSLGMANPNNNNDYEDGEMLTVKYKDYKSDNYSHIITVTVKNNTKSIASLKDLRLTFEYIGEGINPGDFYIQGQEEGSYEDDYIRGIDAGKESNIIFKLPKSIEFDENEYNAKAILVDVSADFYKFRIGDKSLLLGNGGYGCTETFGDVSYN